MSNWNYSSGYANTSINLSSLTTGSGGAGAITIGPATNAHLGQMSVFDLLGENAYMHPDVKSYKVFESPEDVLALSVAWDRLRKEPEYVNKFGKLLDRNLFDKVTSNDKNVAEEIRDYYSKKIMMFKLKDEKRMTAFREDLNKFIHADGKIVNENMLGIAYNLPNLYEYDCNLDYVKSNVEINSNFKNERTYRNTDPCKTLFPIKHFLKKRKRHITEQYWFKDKNNSAVLICIAPDNSLRHIWDHMFKTTESMNITGQFSKYMTDDFGYYSVNKWEIALNTI